MAKTKKTIRSKLDLDGDGDFDKDDKKIAAKALATGIEKGNEELKEPSVEESNKEESESEPEKVEGRVAKVDINLTYRKGDLVPESQIEQWKMCEIDYKVWF